MLQSHATRSHASSAGFGPRSIGAGFVAVLHVVAVSAFATSIGLVKVTAPPPPLITRLIEDPTAPKPLPPPPPLPTVQPPPLPIPLDPFVIDLVPPGPSANTITVPQPEPPINTPPEPVRPVEIRPAGAIEGTHTTPEYPIIARRLAEQGTVRLFLTIGEDGMVSTAVVRRSSGSQRLDAAAIDWVLKHWRYRPAMRGAMPVASTSEASLTFKLN
jgi:periplasmic protein TonB